MPISALPPEISALVFAFCPQAPLVLAQVCTRWRTLVLSNPTLWTRIPPNAHALPLWLERSANLPLDITVDAGERTLLRRFCPYLHRIQSLSLRLTCDMLPVLFGTSVRLPCLRALELLVADPARERAPAGVLVAPKLESLHVRDMTLLSDSLGGSLGTIRSLTIQDCGSWRHPRLFAPLLASCVQLQTCAITFPLSLLLPDTDPIVLPQLRTLTLEWPYLFDPVPLFRALRAPQLRTLRLVHRALQLCLPPHVLGSLGGLVRSAPLLRDLSLQGCHRTAYAEARAFLADCRALERLALVSCQLAERFLAPLTPDDPTDADLLCPRLTHVTVAELRDADVRPIVRFARVRTLTELALHAEFYSLSRYARLLMLSGLLGLQSTVNIVGPFGELLDAQPVCPAVAAVCDL